MRYYTRGMSGSAEAIVHNVTAPHGVDFTAAVSIAFSLSVEKQNGTTSTMTGWSILVRSATKIKATYIPTGTEFDGVGDDETVIVRPTLIVDGNTYRYPKVVELVEAG